MAKIYEIFPCSFLQLLRTRSCRRRPRNRIHGAQGQAGVSKCVKVTTDGGVPLPNLCIQDNCRLSLRPPRCSEAAPVSWNHCRSLDLPMWRTPPRRPPPPCSLCHAEPAGALGSYAAASLVPSRSGTRYAAAGWKSSRTTMPPHDHWYEGLPCAAVESGVIRRSLARSFPHRRDFLSHRS